MASVSISQALELGLQHHSAGRLSEAERIYRQVLAADARNADAMHLLGVLAHQSGQHAAGIQMIQQAIAINPRNPGYFNNLGEAFRACGRLDEAAAAYQNALERDPGMANAWSNLSIVLMGRGQGPEAIVAARRAVAADPRLANAYINLGQALMEQSEDEALQAWARAVELDPRQPVVLSNMSCLLARRGQFHSALELARRAVAIAPDYPDAYIQLGFALGMLGEGRPAVEAARRALQLQPDSVNAYTNLGFALDVLNQIPEAIDALEKAAQLKPDRAEAWKNLGVAQFKLGRIAAAQASYEHATKLEPEYAESHVNLATALLSQGEFERGWIEYEWRWKLPSFITSKSREVIRSWDGSDPTGKTILLISEQGAGDTFQFIRYAPMLAERGARVILSCPVDVHEVIKTVAGVDGTIAPREADPGSDFQLNLLSLPHLFETRLENIPATMPYISADPARVEAWRERLAGDPAGMKVAISWAGNPKHAHDRTRSASLAVFEPLAQVPGVVLYSLQKGEASAQASSPPQGMRLIDRTAELTNFAETAAMLMNVDLLISVDTSVVHLAGAMARPVWTLLPIGPDFRWLREREDSPWYPTMRLFRQSAVLDWGSVMVRVAEELGKLANSNV